MKFSITKFRYVTDKFPISSDSGLEDLKRLFSEHQVRESKDGPLWSPARYTVGSSRGNSNVLDVSCLVLDIDDEVDLDELRSTWEGLTYALHSTFSHSPKKQGYRAVFPLKVPIPAADFAFKYSLMVARLAGSVADPACKDISRMYYLPSCPASGAPYKLAEWNDGELLDPSEFTVAAGPVQEVRQTGGSKPWDRYAATTDWSDLLSPGGATEGKPGYWTRPGKSLGCGCSAHVLPDSDLLYVFTSNWPPFEPSRAYSKLDAYAAIHHGGDVKKACKQLAKEFPDESGNHSPDESESDAKGNAVQKVIGLLNELGVTCFADECGEVFAYIPDQPRLRCVPVRASHFRTWCNTMFYRKYQRCIPAQSMDHTIQVICGEVLISGEESRRVFVRAGDDDGRVIVDLKDGKGSVAIVTADGYTVTTVSPAMFRSSMKQGAIAMPIRRHSLARELEGLFNVKSKEDLVLIAAWLVGFWVIELDAPILALRGEKGCGKTTIVENLHILVDPSLTTLRNVFGNEKDLKASAKESLLLSYDNISNIRTDQSDHLCKLVTGGTIANRANYTDDDESFFSGKRRVVLTSIMDVVDAEDLTDRCMFPELVPLRKKYGSKAVIRKKILDAAPYVVAAILDCISAGLRNLPRTPELESYRLADFGRFIAAAAPSMGFDEDVVEILVNSKSAAMKQHAHDSDFIWMVEKVLEECGPGGFSGTASELAAKMKGLPDRDKATKVPVPNRMKSQLRGHIPMLEVVGIKLNLGESRTASSRGNIQLARVEQADESADLIVTTVIPSQIPPREPEIFELDPFENDDSDDSDGYQEEIL